MSPPNRSRGAHLALLVIALGAWTAVVIAALVQAGVAPWLESLAGFLGSCPHRAITGDPCVLCGTTTAARLLLDGELTASLAVSPLALGLIVLGVTQPVYRLARTVRPRLVWREELTLGGAGLAWLLGVIAAAT
jgi:hypothetical protein